MSILNLIITATATLLAAFLGALSAYKLQDNKEQRKEENNRKSSLNQTLFIILRQYNALLGIEREIKKYKNDPGRAINMPALAINDYADLSYDLESLYFIFDLEGVDINLLLELSVEQERFEQAINCLKLREEFHIQTLQPALSRIGIQRGKRYHKDELKEKLSERIFMSAIQATDQVYESVESTIISLKKMFKKLRNLARNLYPSDKFIKMDEDISNDWSNKSDYNI